MSELRAHLTTVSFILVALLVSDRMCSIRNSENKDYMRETENPAKLIKSLIEEKAGSNINVGRGRPSSYLLQLYDALDGYEEQNESSKVRSYRGLKGEESGFTFSLGNAAWDHVERIEISIKLHTERSTFITAGQNVTLFVKSGPKDTTRYVAQTYASYLIFDISDIKDVLQSRITIGNVLHAGNEHIRFSRRNEPLLLVYEHLHNNPLLNQGQRVRRNANHMQELVDHASRETNLFSCRKYDWHMDMTIFRMNWWIRPLSYNAGYCYGQCLFPLTAEATNSTSYSFMKNMWHSHTYFLDEIVPRACCVPTEYEPLQILYLNSNMEASIMKVANMKVKSCGCR